jgi:hypothetical protein
MNVLGSFARTGSIWEHHAPDSVAEGRGRKDFVGWTAITPIVVLFEYVLGFQPDAVLGELVWDVRRTDEHGVYRYPFGTHGSLDLIAKARSDARERPELSIKSNVPFRLKLSWAGGEETIDVEPT